MKVLFFETNRGDAPVQEYIEALEVRESVKIYDSLQDISERGLRGTLVPVRQIRGKLWEIKIQPHRIFYAVMNGSSLVLLHAYKKQGQKAPRSRSRRRSCACVH
jgi:phage-related protein